MLEHGEDYLVVIAQEHPNAVLEGVEQGLSMGEE